MYLGSFPGEMHLAPCTLDRILNHEFNPCSHYADFHVGCVFTVFCGKLSSTWTSGYITLLPICLAFLLSSLTQRISRLAATLQIPRAT